MVDIPSRLLATSKTLPGPGRASSNGPEQSERGRTEPVAKAGSPDPASAGGGSSGSTSGDVHGADGTTAEELPLDLAFEILKNGRRRRVLEELGAATGDLSIGELSEQIAAWENDKPVAEVTSEERKRVYVGLYQGHLPKMDDADVVMFNKDRGIVAPGEHADLLDRYLTPAASGTGAVSSGRSRSRQWAGCTALVGGLLALSLAVGTVSGVPVSTLGLVVLLAVAGAMTVRETRSGGA